MVQAPNSYPTWFAPKARVVLGFSPGFISHFPEHTVEVGPPAAALSYRVIEPANYHLKVTMTNLVERGRERVDFKFKASVPGLTNQWTAAPRGTVILLHGYGLAKFAMAPWALRLAEEGWRCVLVDLRGHGKSTGRQIFFGLRETTDLSQLLDQLDREQNLTGSVSVLGESYGAALALRWKTVEPRVEHVVAIAPYAVLSNAVLNVAREYAGWMPEAFVKSGVKKLPKVLKVPPGELDTITVMEKSPMPALFIAGADDHIAPPAEVRRLKELAAPESEFIVVPQASHEALTYYFKELAGPVVAWLEGKKISHTGAADRAVLPCRTTTVAAK